MVVSAWAVPGRIVTAASTAAVQALRRSRRAWLFGWAGELVMTFLGVTRPVRDLRSGLLEVASGPYPLSEVVLDPFDVLLRRRGMPPTGKPHAHAAPGVAGLV